MRIDSFKTGLKELGDIVHQKSEAENLIQSQLEAFGAMLDDFETNQSELLTLI